MRRCCRARQGETYELDVSNDMTRLTLDTIALCAMGFRFNSFYLGEEQHPFVTVMNKILIEAGVQSNIPMLYHSLFRRSQQKEHQANIAQLREISNKIVRERRANPDPDANDLLNAMLLARDPETGRGMTDSSITDNMLTFLIAGHETTGGMLSFAMYHLLKEPETLARARAEVDAVVGATPVTADDISRLPYLNAVLRETLRLHPTLPAWTVEPIADTEVIGGKYAIKRGEGVAMLLPNVHCDKRVYGANAAEFKPERMLDEAFEKLPRGAWKPFGNGVRGCIGRAFAWQEGLLALTMVLQNFDIYMDDPNYNLQVKETLTMKPDGFRIRTRLRSHRVNATELSRLLQTSATDRKSAAKTAPGGTSKVFGDPITILYGSNSGTCEALAHQLAADAAAHGYGQPTIKPMSAFGGQRKDLPTNQPVIVLTASYDGQPADDAREFVEWLEKNEMPSMLASVRFSVFGCGHRDWPTTLFRIPQLVDTLLHKAGGRRIAKMGSTDTATSDPIADLETWAQERLWPGLGATATAQRDVNSILDVQIAAPRRILMSQDELVSTTVREAYVLTAPGAVNIKKHVGLELPTDPIVSYRPGDHIIILPFNRPEIVRQALVHFRLNKDSRIKVHGDGGRTIAYDGESASASELLSTFFDLQHPATPKNLITLAELSMVPATKSALQDILAKFSETPVEARPSVLDLLGRFPNIDLPLGSFLAMLAPLKPRTYSISSSPSLKPNFASLTFTVVDAPHADGLPDRRFQGVGSSYLASLRPGDVIYVGIRPARQGFHLPNVTEPSVPIVMIAAGAGFAPFRGFVQELAHRRKAEQAGSTGVAEAVLFFGCRGPEDDIYQAENDAAEIKSVLKVYRAYSKVMPSKQSSTVKGHVQNAMTTHREELINLWKQGAKFYTCGMASMAAEVKALVTDIAREAEGYDGEDEVVEWFRQFEPSRYAAEVFV